MAGSPIPEIKIRSQPMKCKIIIEFDTDEGTFEAEAWRAEPGAIACQKVSGGIELLESLRLVNNKLTLAPAP